jgi:CHAT domain-containing protein
MEMDFSSRTTRESDPAHLCPGPEILAAWVDQNLEAAERAGIDTHLAGCEDCRLLVARVIEFQHAMAEQAGPAPGDASTPGQPLRFAGGSTDQDSSRVASDAARPATVLPFTRRVTRWRVAAFASAAAALLLAVQVLPVWGPGGSSGADSRLADLADAVGQTRTVEARLTGGFRYGPLRAPLRSGGSAAPMDNWTLYAAAGRIREVALQDPSAPNLHGLGLAHLVLGNYDEAVQALEDAIAETPQSARYQSDLAAAYLARAKEQDRPDDVPRALAAAERSIAVEDLLEARFNRALALQSLYLEEQAREAWQEYLARDASSDWAEDARRHLAALQQSENVRNEAARNNSPPLIDDMTVEAGLDWLLRQGLPTWAKAVLARDVNTATRTHTDLREYAQRLSDRGGDPFAVALTTLPGPAEPAAAAQASAVLALSQGLAFVEEDNLEEAEKAIAAGCTGASEPISWLCDLELGALDALRRNDATVRSRLARVETAAAAAGALYVQARAARLSAYRALFSGDYATALRGYHHAFDLAEAGKYRVQGGIMAAQLSDAYDVIGRPLDAWRWRTQALHATTLPGTKAVRYLTWISTGGALSRDSNYEAARAFLGPALATVGTRSRLQHVPPLLSQTRAALAHDDIAGASAALDAASRILAASTDFRAARLTSEVLALKASVAWAGRDLAAAEKMMAEALGAMGPERSARRAAALLERARIRAEAGADLEAALKDLDEATLHLRSRGLEGAQPLPAEETRAAFNATATLISARGDLQGPRGLAISENLRLLLTGVMPGAPPVTAASLEEAAAALDTRTIGVVYLFGTRGLHAWTLANGGVHSRRLAIERADVERRVAALSVQLARTPLREDAWKGVLGDLHDQLLADVPGLGAAAEILIVPDGPLRRVPFGSLVDRRTGAFLFERASVRVVPSLMFGLSKPPVRPEVASILSIGEPEIVDGQAAGFEPLPHARAEAIQVATLYKRASMLVGKHATKDALLAELPATNVLHFAGHALGGTHGLPPRLLLAGSAGDPAAALSLSDLTDRLHGARVVLAACETATAARTDRSLGAADLAGAFLRAGAASVIATLWKIDDVAGQEFFVEVHRGLSSGQSPAMAVAAAQRACRASESCRPHPVTWVGTTVYGLE